MPTLHQKRVGCSIHGRALWSPDFVPRSCQKWPPASLFAGLRSNQTPIAWGFAKGSVDMYYLAAHVRQLIDARVMGNGKSCAKGEITLDQVWEVFADYNGPDRSKSANYGNDAMAKLKGAYAGAATLFFYE
jgi:hypothetical protein